MNTLKSHLFIFMNIFMNNSQLAHTWWSSIKEMSKSLGEWQSRPDHYSPNHIHTILTPLAPFPDQLVPGSHSQQKPTELEAHLILAFYSMHRMNVTLLSTHSIRSGASLRRCGLSMRPLLRAIPPIRTGNTARP